MRVFLLILLLLFVIPCRRNRVVNNRTFSNLLLPSIEEALETPSTQQYAEGGQGADGAPSTLWLVVGMCVCAVGGIAVFAVRSGSPVKPRKGGAQFQRTSWINRNEITPLLSMPITSDSDAVPNGQAL
jgi:hypothetical protein